VKFFQKKSRSSIGARSANQCASAGDSSKAVSTTRFNLFMSQKIDYDQLEALAQRRRWLAISTVAVNGAEHVGLAFHSL
jgi:hypothetical protein